MAPSDQAAQKLRAALELFEAGVDLTRRRLAREHPQDDDAALRARLRGWLQDRDGHSVTGHLTLRRRAR